MSESAETAEKRLNPRSGLGALAVLIVLGILCWSLSVSLRPPVPLGIKAPLEKFSAMRAGDYLGEILEGIDSHPMGSPANGVVRDRIVSILEKLDYQVEIQRAFPVSIKKGRAGPVENILCRLPGKNLDSAVLLVAHYDSREAAPGASDDGSGVAALLEIARIVKLLGPFENSIIFLFDDGEEAGLFGAEAFVTEHPWAGDVKVVINLEARGTSGPSILVETSDDNAWLLEACAGSVDKLLANSLSYAVYKLLPNDTDLTIFKREGFPGLFFAFIDNVAQYHTPFDSLENLDLGSLQHQGDNTLGVGIALANTNLDQTSKGNSVYADIFGKFLIRWPEPWTLPLAVATLLMLLTGAVLLARKKALTWRECGEGMLIWLVVFMASVLMGYGLTLGIESLSGHIKPWKAHPLPTRILLWAVVPLAVGASVWLCSRKAGFLGLFVGGWLIWGLLALTAAIILPGASVVLLIPAMLAAVAILTVALFRSSGEEVSWLEWIACVIAVSGAGYFCFLLAALMEMTFGLDSGGAITATVGLLGGIWAPFLRLSPNPRRLSIVVCLVSGGIILASFVAAVLAPPFSEERPAHLSIRYVLDHENGSANWFAGSSKVAVPESMQQIVKFSGSTGPVYPWIPKGWLKYEASAENHGYPPPDLEIISDEISEGQRLLKTRFRSPRGATDGFFHFPSDSPIASLTVAGKNIEFGELPEHGGFRFFSIIAIKDREVTLEFTIAGEKPVEFWLFDQSTGLPEDGAALLQARPSTHVPYREGDVTIVYQRLEI